MEMPGGGMPYGHLEELLKKTVELSEQNNRILRRMERNALIGFIVKAAVWLFLLGVPIFFLSSYLGPIMAALTGSAGAGSPTGLFGLPSVEQVKHILDAYKAK